ncbi:MAG: nitroreductase family protein [Candidatus Zixiibacteriota bacterium]
MATYMGLKRLVIENRSYRRFNQDYVIGDDTLVDLVNLARFTASGANLQPLKYFISNEHKFNEKIFFHIRWAGYLEDWKEPQEGEKPTAYILILGDKKISNFDNWPSILDAGIAAQTIMLGATEQKLGGCMIAAINRDELHKSIGLDDNLEIIMVLALGKPDEDVVLESTGAKNDIKYYRDEKSVHHVPKRNLDEIIVNRELKD